MEDGLGGAGTRISTWAILGLRRPLRHLSGDVKEASGYEFTVMKKVWTADKKSGDTEMLLRSPGERGVGQSKRGL